MSKIKKCGIGSNKINIKMTSMYNKLWKNILVGDRPYLHEGRKYQI
jgi:hypothetical protein